MPLLCVGPSVQRCHRHVKIVDTSDQSIRTTFFFAYSSEVCSGIVILGRVPSLVFVRNRQGNRPQHLIHVLLCQPRVEVTSCFIYEVMGLTFHNRINTQLIYRFELAQVVARRFTKPPRIFFRFESHWLLFFYSLFYFRGGVV